MSSFWKKVGLWWIKGRAVHKNPRIKSDNDLISASLALRMNYCFLSMPSMDMGLTVVDWHRFPPASRVVGTLHRAQDELPQPFYLLRRTRLFEADPSPALRAAPFSKGGTCLKAPSIENQTFIVRYPISIQAKRSAPKTQDRLPQPLMAEKRNPPA